jgi:hypothetical protein
MAYAPIFRPHDGHFLADFGIFVPQDGQVFMVYAFAHALILRVVPPA